MSQTKVLSAFLGNSTHIEQLTQGGLYDLLPIGVYICDAQGLIKSSNIKAWQLWGRMPAHDSEQFCGSFKLYHPGGMSISRDASPSAQCLLSGVEIKNVELVFERPDATFINVRISSAPIKDKQGNLIGVINCFSDVGEDKGSEWQHKRNAYELQEYVDNAAMSLHWVDSNGIIKWANQAELDMLGYLPVEYIGHHISEFHLHRYKIDDILTRLNANETLHQYESELVCKDGSVRNVQITSNVFRYKGEFVHTRCFTVDVTAHKRVFNSLEESEHRYRELINGLPAAVYTCDVDGYIDLYNPAAAELWGREPQTGKDLWCGSWKIFNPDGSPLPFDACPMAISLKESRQVYGHQIVIQRPDGTKRHVLPYPQPMFNAGGDLVGAVNMLVDVTSLKEAEEALRESEQRFKTAANTAPVLIWMSDTDKNRFFFNKCWTEFTGKAEDELFGVGWLECVHPDELEYVSEMLNNSFEGRQEYKMNYRLLRNDNTYRWIQSHGIPRFATDGSFCGYIGTIVDVHEQKLRKDELEKHVYERTRELSIANEKLERSNKELEQFAYVASHDLQEPLRKIKAFGGMLADKHEANLDATGVDLIRRMQNAASRMNVLIEDLLSYSRVSGFGKDKMERVPLAQELKEVLDDLEVEIKSKHADIQIGPLYDVNGYALQIRQLFQNLLGNALKFSKQSGPVVITVSSRLVKGSESGFKVPQSECNSSFQLIEVIDNGIGFDQQYSHRIFQVFQRLHGTGEYSGSGVGLSIVQKVVELHGGGIRAFGESGKGATFQILLPVLE
jgi:PAS domain S-box-containing protein